MEISTFRTPATASEAVPPMQLHDVVPVATNHRSVVLVYPVPVQYLFVEKRRIEASTCWTLEPASDALPHSAGATHQLSVGGLRSRRLN
jgi:hypothetical protein